MFRSHISAAIFSLAILQASYAGNHETTPKQVIVPYGDLDLTMPAGQTELNARLRAAAVEACGPIQYSSTRPSEVIEAWGANRFCIQWSIERAVAHIRSAKNAKTRARIEEMTRN